MDNSAPPSSSNSDLVSSGGLSSACPETNTTTPVSRDISSNTSSHTGSGGLSSQAPDDLSAPGPVQSTPHDDAQDTDMVDAGDEESHQPPTNPSVNVDDLGLAHLQLKPGTKRGADQEDLEDDEAGAADAKKPRFTLEETKDFFDQLKAGRYDDIHDDVHWDPLSGTPEPMFEEMFEDGDDAQMGNTDEALSLVPFEKEPHIHQDKPLLTSYPNTSSLAAIVVVNKHDGIGSPTKTLQGREEQFRCYLHIDFGRNSMDPAINITFRRPKQIKNPLNLDTKNLKTSEDKVKQFLEVRFIFRPAKHGRTDEHGTKVNVISELVSRAGDDVFANLENGDLTFHHNGAPMRLSDVCPPGSQARSQLAEISFVSCGQEIRADGTMSTLTAGIPGGTLTVHLKNTITDLHEAVQNNIKLYFLCPGDARDYLANSFPFFESMIPQSGSSGSFPFWPYFKHDGKYDISIDMPASNLFCNRALAKYDDAQVEKMEAEKATDPQGLCTFPTENVGIWNFEMPKSFPDAKTLAVFSMGNLVRQEQSSRSSSLVYLNNKFKVFAVAPYKGPQAGARDRKLQFMQQNAIYLVFQFEGKFKDVPPPAIGTVWDIFWPLSASKDPLATDIDLNWKAHVIEMTKEERASSSGHCLMVAYPRGSKRILPSHKIAEDFNKINTFNHHQVEISPRFDNHQINTVCKAIERFTNDTDGIYAARLTWLCRGADMRKQIPYNATKGPSALNMDQQVKNTDMWQTTVKYLKGLKTFTDEQAFSAFERPKTMPDGVAIQVGCPGSGKTLCLSAEVLCLLMVGHKVLFSCKQHQAADNFARAFYELHMELIQHVVEQGNAKADYLDRLMSLSVVRHISVNSQQRDLRTRKYNADEAEGHTTIGAQERDTHLLDSRSDILAEQLIDNINNARALQASIQEGIRVHETEERGEIRLASEQRRLEKERNLMTQRQHEHNRLCRDYERLTAMQSDREITIPIKYTVGYHHASTRIIPDAACSPVELELKQAIAAYDHAVEEMNIPRILDSAQRQRLNDDVFDTGLKAVGLTEAKADMVISTLVQAQNDVCKNFIKPTILMIDEASTVDLGTLICGLAFPTIEAVKLAGDPNQIRPFSVGKAFNEFAKFGDLSALTYLIACGTVHDKCWTQHRGHPDCFRHVGKAFYGDEMKHGEATKVFLTDPGCTTFRQVVKQLYRQNSVPDVNWEQQRFLVDIANGVSTSSGGSGHSLVNEVEAKAGLNDMIAMAKAGIAPADMTALFYYQGTRGYFEELLFRRADDLKRRLAIDITKFVRRTVDGYQGEANKYIFVFTTATPHRAIAAGNPVNSISTHVRSSERLVVADSRARHGTLWYGSWNEIFSVAMVDDKKLEASWKPLAITIQDALLNHIMLHNSTTAGNTSAGSGFAQSGNAANLLAQQANLQWIANSRMKQLIKAGRGTNSGRHAESYESTFGSPLQKTKAGRFPAEMVPGVIERSAVDADNPDAVTVRQVQDQADAREDVNVDDKGFTKEQRDKKKQGGKSKGSGGGGGPVRDKTRGGGPQGGGSWRGAGKAKGKGA